MFCTPRNCILIFYLHRNMIYIQGTVYLILDCSSLPFRGPKFILTKTRTRNNCVPDPWLGLPALRGAGQRLVHPLDNLDNQKIV